MANPPRSQGEDACRASGRGKIWSHVRQLWLRGAPHRAHRVAKSRQLSILSGSFCSCGNRSFSRFSTLRGDLGKRAVMCSVCIREGLSETLELEGHIRSAGSFADLLFLALVVTRPTKTLDDTVV